MELTACMSTKGYSLPRFSSTLGFTIRASLNIFFLQSPAISQLLPIPGNGLVQHPSGLVAEPVSRITPEQSLVPFRVNPTYIFCALTHPRLPTLPPPDARRPLSLPCRAVAPGSARRTGCCSYPPAQIPPFRGSCGCTAGYQ